MSACSRVASELRRVLRASSIIVNGSSKHIFLLVPEVGSVGARKSARRPLCCSNHLEKWDGLRGIRLLSHISFVIRNGAFSTTTLFGSRKVFAGREDIS